MSVCKMVRPHIESGTMRQWLYILNPLVIYGRYFELAGRTQLASLHSHVGEKNGVQMVQAMTFSPTLSME